jgi:hypothetical protein
MARLWAAGLALLAAGCSASDDPSRFYPAEDRARQALDAALTAWQQGAPPGTVSGTTNPRVEFVDSHNGPGRPLKAYVVLGLAPGDGPRVFTVQLSVDAPTAELRVRYYVIGIDPVWVIRKEDYDMLNHWEHRHGPKDKPGKG